MLPNLSALSFKILRDDKAWCITARTMEETVRRTLILTALYFIPAMFILQPVVSDPDIWWHLQTGRWIIEHGTLPITDPFSAFGEGKSWTAYSWLFEIGMYELVSVFGESAIIAYTLVGVWLVMLVMHRVIATRCTQFVLYGALMAAGTLAIARLFTPRPWLLTILFFAITLEVVLLVRAGRWNRWFCLLPAVFIVWANVHIQFVYGLALLGLACAAPVLDRYLKPITGGDGTMSCGSPQWGRLIALTGLCVAATFVTPYHVHLYSIAVQLSGQTGMWEYAQEMQAPTFRSAADWAMLLLFAFAIWRIGWQRSWSSFEILLLLVGGACAFRGARDAWFLVFATIVVLISKDADGRKNSVYVLSRSIVVAVVAGVTVGVLYIMEFRGFSSERIEENTAKLYPIKAASFVEQQNYVGPLYNHYNWGGYIIWRLPQLKVSMDGRANVYGDERIKEAVATWSGLPRWMHDQDLNLARVVIAQQEIALTAILRLDPRFRVVYQDETAVVFTRVPSAHE
jgi:hypothetical protein